MATTAYFLNQYISTTLASVGGIDASQTTGIILASITNIDTTKPGIACLSYTDPLSTATAEWITYTSIDSGTKELQGVTRGQEGYAAKAHSNGVTVAFPLSESHINNLNTALMIGGSATNLTEGVLDEDDMASNSATKVPTQQSVKAYVDSGWSSAGETWEYVSTDDPTGVFRVNADVTAKYSAGMRTKMTNGGNTIYGIITLVSTYGEVDAGYTHITFLHEIDPTDSTALYLMANSAITANYYSTQKCPFGFLLSPSSWRVRLYQTGTNPSTSATTVGYYNIGSYSITIPIGRWVVEGQITLQVTGDNIRVVAGLSTNTTSIPSETSDSFRFNGVSVAKSTLRFTNSYLSLTSKSTQYVVVRIVDSGASEVRVINEDMNPTKVSAICAYL